MEMSGTEMDSLPHTHLTTAAKNSERSKRGVSIHSGRLASALVHNHIRAILSAAFLSAAAPNTLAASSVLAPSLGADTDSSPKTVLVDIKPQALVDALNEWAQQTGLQLIFPNEGESNRMLATRVKGRLTPQAALDKVIAGTTLTYEFLNARMVVIQENDRINEPVLQSDEDVYAEAFRPRPPGEGGDVAADRGKPTSYNDMLLASMVVTGTHIRGVVSAGSRVELLDQGDIDATGYTTIQNVLTSIPANLGGGPSEDFNGGVTMGNVNRGSSINLRGLGANATLVLVNGRRQAASGEKGAFIDVSSIPTSAVSRVEVLTDGASAVYGSDAVGGVVNIVLRDKFEGAESRARYGIASDSRERQVSQIFGDVWDRGSALFGYQFYDREALNQSARRYSASEDKRNQGGDDFRSYLSNPGNILDPATSLPAYAIPSGQTGTSLKVTDLLPGVVNLQSYTEGMDLLPLQQMHSAFASAHWQVGENLSLRADARYSRREMETRYITIPGVISVPASNPFFVDPFGGSAYVLVAYNFSEDFGRVMLSGRTDTFSGTAEAMVNFAGSWHAYVTATHAEEQVRWQYENMIDSTALNAALADPSPETAFNPFGDGSNTNPATLAALRTTQRERARTTLDNLSVTADGVAFRMPGGAAKLAVGLDYREEGLESLTIDQDRLERSILAGFAELELPLIGADNSVPAIRQLDMSLSGRYEDYSDFGSSINPRIGLTWTPAEAVRVRANWGTSFRAPGLADTNESTSSTSISLASIPDPQSPTGQSTVLIRTGNNSQLTEETAIVWNAGLDFLLPGEASPTVSVTYYDIDFRDRIAEGGPAGAASNILLQESQWSELIQRDPSPEDVEALCYNPQYAGDPASCMATPVAAIIDARLRNLGAIRVQGIDLSIQRPLFTSWGKFSPGIEGGYVLHHERAVSKRAASQDIVDTVGNALALRLRGGLSWERNEWSANLFVNYVGDYIDDVSQPKRSVGSWTTVDFRMAYQTPARAEWLGNVELSLDATNALDADPPFVNSRFGYDGANASPIGRMISARVTKWW